jgi:Fe-coproporphyrin III synthase
MKLTCSVITTFRCNARCHMCNIWENPTNKEEEISIDILKKLPDNLYRINITGGEPMLRDDIEDIVEVLHPKAEVLEISTNGFFTEKIVSIAKKFPDILIRVSVEGFPQKNDELRGIKNGFDHALRTVTKLKHLGVKNVGFSIVICDKNATELVDLYNLCSAMDVELGNSIMHNSWYFHKFDNKINDVDVSVKEEKRYIKALLTSQRPSLKGRVKDWLRAYFNRSIYRKFSGEVGFRPQCVAGSDMFFIDPWGNILPCNGTDEKWVMGNLATNSFDEIWNSEHAKNVRGKVEVCEKTCVFVSTDRYEMKRKPWKPILWILRNKLRLLQNQELEI